MSGYVGKWRFPLVYVLCGGKDQPTYIKIWTKLKELFPELKIEEVLLDFERAAIDGVRSVFPEVQVNCCFFHLSQNIFRKIGMFGLRKRYVDDVDFAHGMRMIAALAFVPLDKVYLKEISLFILHKHK